MYTHIYFHSVGSIIVINQWRHTKRRYLLHKWGHTHEVNIYCISGDTQSIEIILLQLRTNHSRSWPSPSLLQYSALNPGNYITAAPCLIAMQLNDPTFLTHMLFIFRFLFVIAHFVRHNCYSNKLKYLYIYPAIKFIRNPILLFSTEMHIYYIKFVLLIIFSTNGMHNKCQAMHWKQAGLGWKFS